MSGVQGTCRFELLDVVSADRNIERDPVNPNLNPERDPKDQAMNIQQMMKQAQQMQDRMQKQMAEMRIEATAGGGMVTVVINGSKQVLSLKIDPEAVSKDDVEMLQDLILAASTTRSARPTRRCRSR